MNNPTYSYDGTTGRAQVFNRTTGAVVCDVTGVDVYVGNLLSKLADEMYRNGYERGRNDAIGDMTEHLAQMAKRF